MDQKVDDNSQDEITQNELLNDNNSKHTNDNDEFHSLIPEDKEHSIQDHEAE
jgi:hypothetical protein